MKNFPNKKRISPEQHNNELMQFKDKTIQFTHVKHKLRMRKADKIR